MNPKPGEFEGTITRNGKETRLSGSIALAPILMGLEQLNGYRGVSPNPTELEWEIRLYEWILAQPDAEAKAREYGNARHRGDGPPLSKRKTVAKLGWTIPESPEPTDRQETE